MSWFVENLIAILVLFLFYISLGSAFFRHIINRQSNLNSKLELLCSFYLGIGLWFILATILGLTGYFNKTVISGIIITTTLLFFKPTMTLIKQSLVIIRNELKDLVPQSLLWKILFGLTLLLVLSGAAGIGNTALEDGAAFYLPFAKMMAYSGWLEKLPGYEAFASVGLIGELQMATLFAFGVEDAARMISWLCFLPVFFLLFEYAKKLELSQKATLVLVLSVFSSSCIIAIIGGGKIELFSAALGLTGILILFFESQFLLAGFLLAFASIAKISLLIPLFPVVLVGFFSHVYFLKLSSREKIKEYFKIIGLFAIPFILVSAPHLIKNYIFFKNPLAPFYGGKITWETSWYSDATTLRIILTYPLVWFYGSYWAQLGTLSLPIITFLPFYFKKSFLLFKNWKKADFLLVSLFLGMILWVVLRPSFVAPRYILAILLCFAPFAAKGFDNFAEKNHDNTKKKYFVVVFLLFWTSSSLYRYSRGGDSFVNAYNYVTSSVNHCERDSFHCNLIEVVNKVVPPGSRILQLTAFTYWLREDLLQTMRKQDEFDFPPAPLNEEVWRQIFEHDFTYLYLDTFSNREFRKTYFIDNLPEWVKLEPVSQIEYVGFYRIIYSPRINFAKKWKVKSEAKHWFLEKIAKP